MANVKRNQLTPLGVKNVAKPGQYGDGNGLLLRVSLKGAKSWVVRVTVRGRRQQLGIGIYPDVGLAEARRRAAEMRERVQRDLPPRPLAVETAPVEPAPAVPTLAQVAAQVYGLRRPQWTSESHARAWWSTLERHALQQLGERPVDTITTADVLAVLIPLWTKYPETGGRIRGKLSLVFDFAVAAGWCAQNPCNGSLKAALPPRPQPSHYTALPYGEVGKCLARIRESRARPSTGLALEFVILTAARSSEATGATWGEVDTEGAAWTIPAERMKSRREHRVPLSTGALDVVDRARSLRGGPRSGGRVFPSSRRQGRIARPAFRHLLKRVGYPNATTHGFRASFRTWALEQTAVPWAVAEAALAHTLGDNMVTAYARSDLFERRRDLMQAWSDFAGSESRLGPVHTT